VYVETELNEVVAAEVSTSSKNLRAHHLTDKLWRISWLHYREVVPLYLQVLPPKTDKFSPFSNTFGSNIDCGTRFPDSNVSVFSVPTAKCQDSVSIRPRLLPPKLFPIYHSSYHSMLYSSLATDSVCRTRRNDRRSISGKGRCNFNVAEPSERNVILKARKALKMSKCCKTDESSVKWNAKLAPTVIQNKFAQISYVRNYFSNCKAML
jgi:hypothetical protein